MQQNPCLGGFSNLEGGNETRVFAIYDELDVAKHKRVTKFYVANG